MRVLKVSIYSYYRVMNLYVRLFLRVWRGLVSRRHVGVQEEATVSFRALPHDLDLNLHVNNGRYLSFMDVGRIDLINRIGVLWPSLQRGWFPIIGDVKINFWQPLGPFQKFHVKTKITHWDHKWFYFEHLFESKGRPIATGKSRGLMRSRAKVIPPLEVLKVIR